MREVCPAETTGSSCGVWGRMSRARRPSSRVVATETGPTVEAMGHLSLSVGDWIAVSRATDTSLGLMTV